MTALRLHPDRALPAEPGTRAVARTIYRQTAELPLLCLHGHVPVETFSRNLPFEDPARLIVVPDHYVTRMLVSQGVRPEDLGLAPRDGGEYERDPRRIWRVFCENWHLFRGTPSRFWLEHEFAEVLGVGVQPSAGTADEIYEHIVHRIGEADFRPLELLKKFRIELLATTDAATDSLSEHGALSGISDSVRIVPTFRPDVLMHPAGPDWSWHVNLLGEVTGIDTGDLRGFLRAVQDRRRAFVRAGALACDHGHLSPRIERLDPEEAQRLFDQALVGSPGPGAAAALESHLLFEQAAMAREDGLVMQLHTGVLRNHDSDWYRRFGPDTGFDIPVAGEFTRSLRPLLEAFGHDPAFRLVLFTVDETVYSRELAPLAGAYPAVRLGAPWWFLDSPEQMLRFRRSATETAGFYNTSGFVDDTRALLSIPARHDLARRVDAAHLARLVTEHRLGEDEAVRTAIDLAYNIPRSVYRCP
ncbi:MAG: glucuronate isomerase [Actinomycetota bacterium]|nr:glucuronate isomerase [Actinomycetota bacterium]